MTRLLLALETAWLLVEINLFLVGLLLTWPFAFLAADPEVYVRYGHGVVSAVAGLESRAEELKARARQLGSKA